MDATSAGVNSSWITNSRVENPLVSRNGFETEEKLVRVCLKLVSGCCLNAFCVVMRFGCMTLFPEKSLGVEFKKAGERSIALPQPVLCLTSYLLLTTNRPLPLLFVRASR